MEIRPVASVPELARNDVYLRYSSDSDQGLRIADTKTKATGSGTTLDYGATTRDVALAGKSPIGATMNLPDSGSAQGPRFEMSLASGTAHIPGPGLLTSKRDTLALAADSTAKPDIERTFSWTDQADFQFQLNEKKEVVPVIAEVHASGSAKATDGKGSISGDALIAWFKPVSDKVSRIDRLQVIGQATGEDGRRGQLSSDTLDVTFVPNEAKPDQSDPSVVTAQGNVKAQRTETHGPSILTTSYLQAQVARSSDTVQVTSVTAKDGVAFENADGIKAKSAELQADPVAHTAHLTGPAMGVEVSKEGTTIAGQDMTFSEQTRKLMVTSAGMLVHEGALRTNANGDQPASKTSERTEVTWSRNMSFNDAEGLANCSGDVKALTNKQETDGGLTRDTVHAEQVSLTLTPAPQPAKDTQDAKKEERRLLTMQALGTRAQFSDGKPATIESRHFAPPTDSQDPIADRLMYLEAATIRADNEHGLLNVPVPGKLLFMDRRAAQQRAAIESRPKAAPLSVDSNEGAKGTSLFTWTGSMNMNRPNGKVVMNQAVRLVHQDPEGKDKTELECETLTANVREVEKKTATATTPKNSAAPDSFSGELQSADAQGAVWLRSQDKEITADSLHFDAITKMINARSNEGNFVTLFDAKTGQPVTAREIDWDRIKDRIDIRKPGPIISEHGKQR
jgi:hypothetical protein